MSRAHLEQVELREPQAHKEQQGQAELLVELVRQEQQEPQAKAYRLEGQRGRSWRRTLELILMRGG